MLLMPRRMLLHAAVSAVGVCLLPTLAAHADPITYTVTLTGTVMEINNSIVAGDPVFSFTGDTSAIQAIGGGYYQILVSGGTIALGGNTYSLDGQQLLQTSNLLGGSTLTFEPDNGSAEYDVPNGQFGGYNFATPINATSFVDDYTLETPTSLDGGADTMEVHTFSGNPTLTLDAALVTPEPSSLALLGTGCRGGLAMLRRRFQ